MPRPARSKQCSYVTLLPKQKFPKSIEMQVQFMPFSHTKGGCASAVRKTVELSLVQHIERFVEVTVVITAPNTKPAAVAVHRQVVEIIDIPLVTQTVSTNRKIQLRRHRRWDPSRWVRRYGANSPLGWEETISWHPTPQGKQRSRTSFEMTESSGTHCSRTNIVEISSKARSLNSRHPVPRDRTKDAVIEPSLTE